MKLKEVHCDADTLEKLGLSHIDDDINEIRETLIKTQNKLDDLTNGLYTIYVVKNKAGKN